MNASVGQITGTRVDSASKHIIACRVSEDALRILCDPETRHRIHLDKHKYCMHKDELVLCVAKPFNPHNRMTYKVNKQSYPPVITTLGDVTEATKDTIRNVYAQQTERAFNAYKHDVQELIPEFQFQGVANALAWATMNHGDNIASVLVCGMATIMNGHFHCYTGDYVQWYFDFEHDVFQRDGRRMNNAGANLIPIDPSDNVEEDKTRREFFERNAFGNYKNEATKNFFKKNVVYPKPFYFNNGSYGDSVRVFGRVMNGGRPFEPIDVLIMSQCS
jgi:hypothetical protein